MSLEPARYSFHAYKGSTWRKQITVLTGGAGSTPRDLTNYSAAFTIHDESNTTLLSLTTSNGGITLGGITGTLTVLITAAQTSSQTWQAGEYSLMITAPTGGDTDPLLYGTFTIHTI